MSQQTLQFRFSQCRDDSSQGSKFQVEWFPSQPPPPEEGVLERLLESQNSDNSERPIYDVVSQPEVNSQPDVNSQPSVISQPDVSSQPEVTEWYQLLESDFPPFILRRVASPTSSQTTNEGSHSQPLFSSETSESGFGSENSSNED